MLMFLALLGAGSAGVLVQQLALFQEAADLDEAVAVGGLDVADATLARLVGRVAAHGGAESEDAEEALCLLSERDAARAARHASQCLRGDAGGEEGPGPGGHVDVPGPRVPRADLRAGHGTGR